MSDAHTVTQLRQALAEAEARLLRLEQAQAAAQSHAATRHNQALLAQIMQNSPVAVALTREADGSIVDVNAEWSRLTGYPREQALGRTTVALGFWRDGADRAAALRPLQHQAVVNNPESRMHTRDGRHVVTAMHGARIDVGGQTHILVYLLDMTARSDAEEALRRLNSSLEARVAERTRELALARDLAERASRVKSEFLSSMSHELRTPLNAILGFSQLLQADPALAPLERQRRFVREILRAGDHLLALISEVLDLARIESGKLPISMEPVDLAGLSAECLALLRPLAQERQISLHGLPPGPAVVQADRTRVRQVLLNLLSNAIKYNHDGGQVSLRCSDEGPTLCLTVHDTGPGLSADQQARLFQDFERLDADRSSAQGSGIGLALSRRLVQMMDGEIGVHSQPGQGSSFWLRLQRAGAPVQAPAPAPLDGAAVTAGSTPPRTRRLLYIEDNPANALLLEGMLAHRPHLQLQHASLPELGLDLAHSTRPDLVLLDIQLPGIDGYEVLRRLRLDAATRAIPVLALSANAMRSDVERGLAAGFAHYLAKPLDMRLLLAVLDGLLPP
jgi:PAS domain S-box-containing protein